MLHVLANLLFLASAALAVGVILSALAASGARIGVALRGASIAGYYPVVVARDTARRRRAVPARSTSTTLSPASIRVA